ncbi:MAG: DUF1232 domain-containing protein [Armatimonadota bacterium]|nr:MAG: DUF1232 domain-containing protein [Armatimonadota bacterium]
MSEEKSATTEETTPAIPEPRARAKRQLRELLLMLPNLAKLLGRLAVHPDVPAQEKALLAATIAYLAMPIDIIPDFVPGLGQVDDIFLVAVVLQRLINSAGEDLVLQNWDGDPKLLSIIQQILEVSTYFLPKPMREKLVGHVSANR